MSRNPIVLDASYPKEALMAIAQYLRFARINDDRAVFDTLSHDHQQLLGYWQTENFLNGLLDIASECERIAGLTADTAPPLPFEDIAEKAGAITADQLQNHVRLLSGSCWCRRWLHYAVLPDGTHVMAIQCFDAYGVPTEVPKLKDFGFIEDRRFTYLIRRIDESGNPFVDNTAVIDMPSLHPQGELL